MLPRPLHALLNGLAIRQKGIRDFFNAETTKNLKRQTNLTLWRIDRIAYRKNHRQLAVGNNPIVDLEVVTRDNSSLSTTFSIRMLDSLTAKMIFRFVPGHRVKPGGRVVGNSMQCPMLRRF